MSTASNKNQPEQAPTFLGIDAGTSGIRACLIDVNARPIAEIARPLPPPEVNGNRVSQSPHVWANTLSDLLRALADTASLQDLKTIAIDGTSGTVFFTDDTGEPLCPALMYNDARSGQEVDLLKSVTDSTVVQAVTAGLPKLLWLERHADGVSSKARFAAHQADWLGFLLTGRPGHSDVNNCLKTGYDPFANQWPHWLDQLPGIRSCLPEVHSPGAIIAPISEQAARHFHLPVTARLVAGTTDSHAAILATGVHRVGEAVTSLGSTLVTKVISEKPVFDERYGIYSQPFGHTSGGERLWLVGGASNSGGAVLQNYFKSEEMQKLSEQINPAQDTGLDYYPLNKPGERFPINDPDYQPRLTPRPDNDLEFFQGLLEGIAKIEKQAYELLAELGAPYPVSIRTVGGGAINKNWSLIRARYCHTEILQSEYTEAAYGSALLALRGYEQ